MVTVLPPTESFGAAIGRALGSAAHSAAKGWADRRQEQAKIKRFQDIISPKQAPEVSNEDIKQKFLSALPEIEQNMGRELTPQDLDQIWQRMQPQQMGQALQGKQQSSMDPMAQYEAGVAAGLDKPYLDVLKTKAEFGQQEKLAERKIQAKEKAEERKEGAALAKPTLERGRELLEDLPYKENALAAVKDAIESGNLGMFSLDNLAEMTGIEGLRSPEGATFKTASKEFFLGNLSRVGSRGLNQMMEKVVLEMAPLIGRSTEANLAVTEILGAENDVTRKEAELIHDIGSDYKEKHGHYPEDLAHRVYKELRPYAQQRQKDALAEVEKIKSRYAPKNKEGILMYDPAGNLRRVPYGNKKEALKEGYRMP